MKILSKKKYNKLLDELKETKELAECRWRMYYKMMDTIGEILEFQQGVITEEMLLNFEAQFGNQIK